MTDENWDRAEAYARQHIQETGHQVHWAFNGSWFCDDDECGAGYPPKDPPSAGINPEEETP